VTDSFRIPDAMTTVIFQKVIIDVFASPRLAMGGRKIVVTPPLLNHGHHSVPFNFKLKMTSSRRG
jgi:hypothetical protein